MPANTKSHQNPKISLTLSGRSLGSIHWTKRTTGVEMNMKATMKITKAMTDHGIASPTVSALMGDILMIGSLPTKQPNLPFDAA